MYVWWLNQSQCEEACDIIEKSPEKLPEYLRDELDSRDGRAGRGRLWIHRSLPQVSVDPWPDTELGHELAGRRGPELDAGGIVFKPSDMEAVRQFPGTITDLKLQVVQTPA